MSPEQVQALYLAGGAGKCISPVVLAQPESQRVPVGTNVTLSVVAVGGAPLSYQWVWNGSPMEGATTSALTLPNAQLADSGSYWVVVSNPYAQTVSDPALVTVYEPLCTLPSDTLAGWWAGEDNTFDAICLNPGAFQGVATFAPGTVGRAFDLDGTNRYVNVPDNASLNPADALTVEAWVYPRPPFGTPWAPILKKSGEPSGQQHGYSLELCGSDVVRFWVYLDGGQGWRATEGGGLPAQRWSHVAGVYDGTSVSLYVNGVLVGTPTSAPGRLVPSSLPLQLGHDPSNAGRYFNGLIDEASVYTTALSPAQVQAVYEAGVAGKCTIPADWLARYFGPDYQTHWYAGVTADADGDGVNNLQEYLGGRDPNKIVFRTVFTNLCVSGATALATVTVLRGVPIQMALLLDSTNFATTNWTSYSATIPVNLGSTEGAHRVWIGLKGWATNSVTTWQGFPLTRDTVAPVVCITNPPAATVSRPTLQLQGYALEPLAGVRYDLANAAGTFTSLEGHLIRQWFDTNQLAFTTNWFECLDIPLTNGVNTITLYATDLAGNVSTTVTNYTLDYSNVSNGPALTLYWPQDGARISGTTFALRGLLDDPTAAVTAQITDASNVTTQVEGLVERSGLLWVEHLPLGPGANTLSLTMSNAAGYSNTVSLTVTQSEVAITINDLAGVDLNQPRITVLGTISTNTYTVWVNGMEAAIIEPNPAGAWIWQADSVPVNEGGTAVIQARAIPNTDNGGHGTGGSSGTNCAMADPGNPFSPEATDKEGVPDKGPEVVAIQYGKTLVDTFTSPSGYHDVMNESIRWETRKAGSWFRSQCRGTASVEYWGCDDASWAADGTGVRQTGGNVGAGVCGVRNYTSSEPYTLSPTWPGESCSVSAEREVWGYDEMDHQSRVRRANTRYELHTNGKGGFNRWNLFVLSGEARAVGDFFWPEVDPEDPWGYDIAFTNIVLGGFGRLGADGRRYRLLPDNFAWDITPIVRGNPYYIFPSPSANRHHLRILANGSNCEAEYPPTTPDFIVGQLVTFTSDWEESRVSSGRPPDIAIATNRWTFYGKYYNDGSNAVADVSWPTCSSNYFVNGKMLTNDIATNWWVSGRFDPAASYPVELVKGLTFSNGQHVVLNAYGGIQMYRPDAKIITRTKTVTVDDSWWGVWALNFGKKPPLPPATPAQLDAAGYPGILFSNYIRMPTNYSGGTNCEQNWVQVILSALLRAQTNDGSGSWYRGTAANALDGAFSYGYDADYFPYPCASDCPGLPLMNHLAGSDVASYCMWLLFRPPSGQWVPLRNVVWDHSGVATNLGGVNWILLSGSNSANPPDADAQIYPWWTNRIVDAIYLNIKE